MTRMAEKNEALAAGFEDEGRNVTAHDFYRRAAEFYRRALVYMPDTDPRMMQSHDKLKETFDKAWSLVTPPFERGRGPLRGPTVSPPCSIRPGASPAPAFPPCTTTAAPTAYCCAGWTATPGQYVRRGMSFIDVDGPGHGATLREKKLYAPPDSERVAKGRHRLPGVAPRRGPGPQRPPRLQHGRVFRTPMRHRGERIKAVAVWSGAYHLVDDIFDYYPPIQDRLRWLMGASDLKEARERIKEFTLVDRAHKIECPLLVGYNHDDRVMDPRGAIRLYENAVNARGNCWTA